MRSVLKLYQRLLFRYPIPCQSVQTGILVGAGDVISQTIVEDKPLSHYHYERTLQFFAIGTFGIGPTLTIWYRTLARAFGETGGKKVAIRKVVVDQIIFAPFSLGFFLSIISLVQGHTFEETKQLVKKNYIDVLITNYKVWPLVQICNFYVVPTNYQVLVVQIAAIFWNAYIAFKTKPEDDK